jgi:hypothetical protein
MLLTESACVSGSNSDTLKSYSSHENISCEKFTPKPEKELKSSQNDLNSQVKKRDPLGFISLSTNGTHKELIKIDRNQSRMKRMKHGILTAARLHDEDLTNSKSRFRRAMITLTYAKCDTWKAEHVGYFMRLVRQWCKRRSISVRYVWVAELQKRGAVHYHIIFWLPRGITLPKPDKQGWWPHGSTRIEWVRRPIAYLANYTTKGKLEDASRFPKGCRIHAFGGLSPKSQNERTWWLMPKWVKAFAEIEDMPRRAQGGGILLKSTGEIVPSPWEVKMTNYGIFVVQR